MIRLAVGVVAQEAPPNGSGTEPSAPAAAHEYTSTDVGAPALAGHTVAIPGGLAVTGGGKTIGGTSDQFQFGWQEQVGDFDLQARVEDVTITDPFVHAGLMARENLDAPARFAAVFASSAQLGCFFESRANAGSGSVTATPRSGFPVNYPYLWLRLQRAGNSFNGYASLDGVGWTLLGSATLGDLPARCLVGFAVTSDHEALRATARFQDIRPTASPVTGPLELTRESPGPSSRTTGLIVSELMYHPPDRPDGRNLEFVELYNARSVFEDLTGWRLSGDVDFEFPDGFRLQAGETVLIAAAPEDLEAAYGVPNVLGPYRGSLPNDTGRVRLRNNAQAIRLDVQYRDTTPWPPSADGAGHSLVLARPSYGEDDPRAWAASEFRGGSPGNVDPSVPTPEANVVINEFLAHTDDPVLDFIELWNRSNDRVDLSGMVLTDSPGTNRFRVPAGTSLAPRAFRAWTQRELGFALDAAGETIYLINAAGTRVLDAVRFDAQENGIASGRCPDGGPAFRRLRHPTPGAANAPRRPEAVVINEIMYHPISGDSDDQFLELHNPSPNTVSLAGWRLLAGVNFTFPADARIRPDGYLVVARNAVRLRAGYPQLNDGNCLGDFEGTLSDRAEHIALAKPDTILATNTAGRVETNLIHIVVAEAAYADGGRWGQWADGGGSSLERTDPRGDPLQPSSWADSDEREKAPWKTIEFTGRLDNANGAANRLHLGLLGVGECLLDDVEVFRVGSTNLLSNPDFEAGATGWLFSGNHSTSTVESTGAASGTRCLHLRAQGDGDTGPNSLRTALRSTLRNNDMVTLRAKARWLAGWPQVLMRLHGNGLELAGDLEVPRNLGTPGLPNTRRVANLGPAIDQVTHQPPLPAANEPVRVSGRVSDADGVGEVQLRYRLDPATTLTTLAMHDDGTQGDELAGDGIYSAMLPGRASGNLAAFRITATDQAASPASSVFPAESFTEAGNQDHECLVRWGDTVPFGTFAHYHLWFTRDTRTARQNALDNTWRDSTLVYGNHRIIYNAGFRDKGSPYHGGAGDIAVTTPRDEPLLGSFDRVFASTGNGGSEATGIRSQLAAWYAQQLGIPYLHAHYMRLYFNGSPFRPDIMEDLEQPNHDYAERWFPAGGLGDLYKIAVWFEFNDDNRGFNATSATAQRFLTLDNEYKLARYRWNWQRRSNDGNANNYEQLFHLISALNDTSNTSVTRVLNQADMEQWMRAFCYDYAMGNWDVWTYNVGQNMYLYRPLAERWVLIPWDIDFVFGLGDGASTSLRGGGQDPIMSRAYANPTYQRMNWRAYQDTIQGPFLPANFQPQIDARRSVLVKNAVTGITPPNVLTSWINSRRAFIASQLNNADARTFEITTNGGADFESPQPAVTLTGTAPFAVASLEVNGVPYPVSWANVRTFSVTVPLTGVTNQLALVGKDLRGNVVSGATDSIQVRYSGAVERIENFVVINEVHYDAAPTEPGSTFIELFNRSSVTPFDLSGFVLQGVGYTFPAGTILAPQSYLLLVGNRVGFEAAYGGSLPVLGEFDGSLDNDGERLALLRARAGNLPELLVSDLRYWHQLPWPTNAAGWGPSLQLVDASQGSWRVANWAATSTNALDRTTPGRANATTQPLETFPPIWLNEVQPENLLGPLDSAGDRDPWIELYNASSTTVNLSACYLTDSYADPTRWRFPAGLTLGPRQFLVVWVDGELAESSPGEPHTTFRLTPGTGTVALNWLQGTPAAPATLDFLEYTRLAAGRSAGSYPDGEPRSRRQFVATTPGGPNNPALPALQVRLNEIMASNTQTLADPADGDYDDWFELYNAGSTPADLSGYTLTDNLDNPTQHTIPPGTVIPPSGFLLVWADEETGQNAPDGELHVGFRLASQGEQLGLFDLNRILVDGLSFGPQADDVSLGRYPDGAGEPLFELDAPTPREPNYLEGGNRPPVFTAIPHQSVDEETPLRLTVHATDPDPGQTVRYTLGPDAPPAASVDALTGRLEWTPSEADGPGSFEILVLATDDGSPPRVSSIVLTVDVAEVNQPPALGPIPADVADEGTLYTRQFTATDPDVPENRLVFSFGPGAPADATLREDGAFAWTPPETMGGNVVTLTLQVTDQGNPPLTDSGQFAIAVREVPNPPEVPFLEPQFVDEGATFRLQMTAFDPDTPPSPLRFTFDDAPVGVSLDPATGWITWPTTEATGPTNAIFVVRVTELNPPYQSTARTFSVAVNEVNEPPFLAPISDRVVPEGTLLVITNVATDSDLPSQQLLFSLAPGAPAEATLDPFTGRFTWPIGGDVGSSTNLITVHVTDDALDARTSSRTFSVVVVAEPRIVINEIMYRAAVSGAEFVELYNASTNTTWRLADWRLTGTSYRFPADTSLAPGEYLVVARDRARFELTYGPIVPGSALLGDYVNLLGPDERLIELYRPGPDASELRVNRVAFRATAPWPLAANGTGPSLQLIDARQDNARVGNWAAISGQPTNTVRNVLPIEATWRYWQAADNPPPGWTNSGYDDGQWPTGKALLYVENAELPAAKNTPLTLGQMSYLFRTRFTFDGNPLDASLRFETVIDDGAVCYLNGVPVLWLGMSPGAIPERSTPATRTVGDAAYEGPFLVPVNNLRVGENTLAVEVHQTNSGSSDIVMGLSLDVLEVGREPHTPGYANSVRAVLEPFPELGINEVLAVNRTGLLDNAGDPDPWIELANAGPAPVPLDGWYLSDDYAALARWPFPGQASLAPGEFRLVWGDAQPSQTTPSAWHANFRLAAPAGIIVLSRLQLGRPAIVDFLEYTGLTPDVAFGYPYPRREDSEPEPLTTPTPGAPNAGLPAAPQLTAIELRPDHVVTLRWTTVPGRTYRVEAASSLPGQAWRNAGQLTATGAEAEFTDPVTNTSETAAQYYRVVLLP